MGVWVLIRTSAVKGLEGHVLDLEEQLIKFRNREARRADRSQPSKRGGAGASQTKSGDQTEDATTHFSAGGDDPELIKAQVVRNFWSRRSS